MPTPEVRPISKNGRTMLVPNSAESASLTVVPIERKKGKKSARVEASLNELVMLMKAQTEEREAERTERALEKEAWRAEAAQQASVIEGLRSDVEAVQRDNLGGGSEVSSRSGDLHHLVKEKALMETSRGEWRSNLLEGCILPPSWPMYEWMKHWSGRMTIVRALLALQELQKNKTLKEAVRELKLSCNKLGRSISPSDHRLLTPIMQGLKSDYEQDVWELCLLGVADLPYYIPSWMYICRTVKPVLVENTAQWNAIVAGGVWPYSCSDGFKIGRYKDKTPFVPVNQVTPAAGAAAAVGAGTGTGLPTRRRFGRFGRLGN